MDVVPEARHGELGSDGNGDSLKKSTGSGDSTGAVIQGHGIVPLVYARDAFADGCVVCTHGVDSFHGEGTPFGEPGGSTVKTCEYFLFRQNPKGELLKRGGWGGCS